MISRGTGLTGLALICVAPLAGAAEVPVESLIARLDAESFQDREGARKSLVERVDDLASPVLTALTSARYSEEPEIGSQANLALREIFDLLILGKGRRDVAAVWTYWFDVRDGKLVICPIIRELKEGSFLAKAGIRAGDVLLSTGKERFDTRGSVAKLSLLLEQAPAGGEIGFTVLRGTPDRPFEERVETMKLMITPADVVKAKGRDEEPGEYDAWWKTLGKSGIVPE